MAWKIEFHSGAEKELAKVGSVATKRILQFLHDRVAPLDNPRAIGQALKGSELGEFWKYRVGDYRVIARIEDSVVTIFVVRIGDRKSVYR
ncbi:type II toxin-antitoxin system RelE family toxin [Shinella sp. G-2]|uniref:type II toxin-antitoxin system RelE family toxin n=1 Tax=Shinella sp. G-2 TaxID=3133141 RepID=UPI003D003CB7